MTEYEYSIYSRDGEQQALIDAFCTIFKGAEYHYAHAVFDDQNLGAESIDRAITDIDQFHDDNVALYGERAAKLMRDATLHMLHILKLLDEHEARETEQAIGESGYAVSGSLTGSGNSTRGFGGDTITKR